MVLVVVVVPSALVVVGAIDDAAGLDAHLGAGQVDGLVVDAHLIDANPLLALVVHLQFAPPLAFVLGRQHEGALALRLLPLQPVRHPSLGGRLIVLGDDVETVKDAD